MTLIGVAGCTPPPPLETGCHPHKLSPEDSACYSTDGTAPGTVYVYGNSGDCNAGGGNPANQIYHHLAVASSYSEALDECFGGTIDALELDDFVGLDGLWVCFLWSP